MSIGTARPSWVVVAVFWRSALSGLRVHCPVDARRRQAVVGVAGIGSHYSSRGSRTTSREARPIGGTGLRSLVRGTATLASCHELWKYEVTLMNLCRTIVEVAAHCPRQAGEMSNFWRRI